MVMDEHRRPIYSSGLKAIRWEKYGARVRLDPLIKSLFNYTVYRYATIAEALALCDGRIAFAKPNSWPDKYESHLVEQLFANGGPFASAMPYVKCFSVEYSSEAMWRTYSGPGGLVRVGIKLYDLINSLDRAEWPIDAKLYVGRVRYMDPDQIREEIDSLQSSRPKAVMNNAMAALLMMRAGFAFENEVRIAFLPKTQQGISEVISPFSFPALNVQRMLLDPYLPAWQTDQLQDLFKRRLKVGFEVKRSAFDAHPIEFAQK